jgi:cell division septation protein DedD
MRRLAISLLLSTFVAGASAAPRQVPSAATLVPQPAIATIRDDVVQSLVALFPPALVRIYLNPGTEGFGASLALDLRHKGYAVAESRDSAAAAPGFDLAYQLDRVAGDLYHITLKIGPYTMARAYLAGASAVEPAGAWSFDITNATPDIRERIEVAREQRHSPGQPATTTAAAAATAYSDAGSPEWAAWLRAGPPPAQPPHFQPTAQAPAIRVQAPETPPPLPSDRGSPESVASVPVSASASPPPPDPTPTPAKSSAGPWRVQLGAYRGQADAALYAAVLLRRHAAALSTASPYYLESGTIVPHTLLQAGPYATRADALSVCRALRASRADCIVVMGG